MNLSRSIRFTNITVSSVLMLLMCSCAWDVAYEGSDGIYQFHCGTERRLTATPEGLSDRMPKWSHDGKKLAFLRDHGQTASLWVFDSLRDPPRRLVTSDVDDHYSYDWSRDDRTIVYGRPDDQIFTVDVSSGGVRQLTPTNTTNGSPTYSGDGRKILFLADVLGSQGIRRSDVFTMNLDGSNRTPILREGVSAFFANWSPDNTQIAVGRRPGLGLGLLNPDGTNWRLVAPTPFPTNSDWEYKDWPIAWSADSSRLAYACSSIRLGVCIVNRDGSPIVKTINRSDRLDRSPDWAPVGFKFLFTRAMHGVTQIWLGGWDDEEFKTKQLIPEGDHANWRPGERFCFGDSPYNF